MGIGNWSSAYGGIGNDRLSLTHRRCRADRPRTILAKHAAPESCAYVQHRHSGATDLRGNSVELFGLHRQLSDGLCRLLNHWLHWAITVGQAMTPNRAFESGRADKQRAFGLRPWWRAAQRERSAS